MLTMWPEYSAELRIHSEYGDGGIVRLAEPTTAMTAVLTPFLRGDPGPSGAEQDQHIHEQTVAADSWTVNHNKGYRPDAHVFTPGWVEVEAYIIHTSDNQLIVQFNSPQTGFVIC